MADDNPFADLLAGSPQQPDNPFADLLAKPETSAMDAFGRAATGAASFGFRDEGSGLIAAGGGDPNDPNPATALFHLGRGAYRKLTGDPEAEQRYSAEVERQRAQTKQFEEASPGASLAGTVTGSVVAPFGIAARGVGWGAKALAAAGTGAVQGGLTGLGEGEGTLGERIPGAVAGSGIGAAAGGVISPVLGAVGWGVRKTLGPSISTIRDAIRGTPAAQAGVQKYATGPAADIAAGEVTLTPQQMAAAQARSQDVTGLEQYGTSSRALGRAAADIDPRARATLAEPLQERFETQGPRLANWLEHMTTFRDPVEKAATIRNEGKLVNSPLYNAAYEAGDRPILNDELRRLMSAPAVQDAMKESVARWRDRQVLDGYGNLDAPITINPRTQELQFTDSRGFPTEPNLQLWDYTVRNLSQKASDAFDPIKKEGNEVSARLAEFAQRLKTELHKEVPEFKTAQESARTTRGHQNAVDFGRDFFGAHRRRDFAEDLRDFGSLNDAQKKLAADAYIARFMEVANGIGRKENLITKIKDSENFSNEMRTILGPQKAAEIEDYLKVETLMERSRRDISGGSLTARYQQDIAAAGLGGSIGALTLDSGIEYRPEVVLSALATTIGNRRLSAVHQGVMREVATRLVSGNPDEYSQALQMITTRPWMRKILDDAVGAAKPAVKPTSATLGRLTGTAAGRATAEREQ